MTATAGLWGSGQIANFVVRTAHRDFTTSLHYGGRAENTGLAVTALSVGALIWFCAPRRGLATAIAASTFVGSLILSAYIFPVGQDTKIPVPPPDASDQTAMLEDVQTATDAAVKGEPVTLRVAMNACLLAAQRRERSNIDAQYPMLDEKSKAVLLTLDFKSDAAICATQVTPKSRSARSPHKVAVPH